jgi:cytochrome o ubiquinol oxidase subunit 1
MLAFFPLYALGIMGLPRRSVAYTDPRYVPLEWVAFLGALIILAALLSLLWQLWVSIKQRGNNRVPIGDPWDGRSLEWSIAAPPPEYNFAVIPVVSGRDAFTMAKENDSAYPRPLVYTDIELPANSAMGPLTAAIGFALTFALVWHIWWLVLLSFLAAVASMIGRGFVRDTTRVISAAEVERQDRCWLDSVRTAPAVSRAHECQPLNMGLAESGTDEVAP